jgi:hypothetical protein
MRLPEFLTFTGADDTTDVTAMVELSADMGFDRIQVNWGAADLDYWRKCTECGAWLLPSHYDGHRALHHPADVPPAVES